MTAEKTSKEKAEDFYSGLKEVLERNGTVIVVKPLNFNERGDTGHFGAMPYNPRFTHRLYRSPFQFSSTLYLIPSSSVNNLDVESLNDWVNRWSSEVKDYGEQHILVSHKRPFVYDEKRDGLIEWPTPLVEAIKKVGNVEEEYILKFEESMGGIRFEKRNLSITTRFKVTAFPHDYAARNSRQSALNEIRVPFWVWQYPANKKPLFDYISNWFEESKKDSDKKGLRQIHSTLERLAADSCLTNTINVNLGSTLASKVLNYAEAMRGNYSLRRLAVFIAKRVVEVDPNDNISQEIISRSKQPYFLGCGGIDF